MKPGISLWDGSSRTSHKWDGLKKESEEWNWGECHIHLYERGSFRKGYSLRVSHSAITRVNFECLFKTFAVERSAKSVVRSRKDVGPPDQHSGRYDIYIPARRKLNDVERNDWHVTTRNFLAFCCKKPLVGVRLSSAIIALRERLALWRPTPSENEHDLTAYLEEQGYLNFSHCPDYALAMLSYAGRSHKDLWVDAFSHCVGMKEVLVQSPEYEVLPLNIKNFIAERAVQMYLHLLHVEQTLGDFCEDELSVAHNGLSANGRAHLDQFRGFLQAFYAKKYGDWPPSNPLLRRKFFSRSRYRSLYSDFRSLYDYLVDVEASTIPLANRATSRSINNPRAIQQLEDELQCWPLASPHLQPVRKDTSSEVYPISPIKSGHWVQAPTNVYQHEGNFHFGTPKPQRVTSVYTLLIDAYRKFERNCNKMDSEVSALDTRNIHWTVIFCTLRTLLSVTWVPSQVRDVDGPSYPLCCNTEGLLETFEDSVVQHVEQIPKDDNDSKGLSFFTVELDAALDLDLSLLIGSPKTR